MRIALGAAVLSSFLFSKAVPSPKMVRVDP